MKTNSNINPIKKFAWPMLFIIVLLVTVSSHAKENQKVLLVWGDSLSAAYNMPVEQGWVNLLREKYKKLQVINGSISGETTQGGLTRLPEALKTHKPDIVLLELGANDGLRGISIKTMKANLAEMTEAIQKSGAKVILAGMKIPPNYGIRYTKLFEDTYEELAEEYNAALIPFFLEDIADNFDLVQADGLHPTIDAQKIILKTVEPFIDEVVTAKLQ